MNEIFHELEKYTNINDESDCDLEYLTQLNDNFKLLNKLCTSGYLNAQQIYRKRYPNTVIASFDIGLKYAGFYVEEFDSESDSYIDFKILDWRMFNPLCEEEEKQFKTKTKMFEFVLTRLRNYMDNKSHLWDLCSVFLIEKQLSHKNYNSARIQHFIYDYFKIKYPNTEVVLMESRVKSRVCIQQPVPSKYLKVWALLKTLQILEFRGDQNYIKLIKTEHHKPEDYADPFLQLRAYKLMTYPNMKETGCELPTINYIIDKKRKKTDDELELKLEFEDYQIEHIEQLLNIGFNIKSLKKECTNLKIKNIRTNASRIELFQKLIQTIAGGEDNVALLCQVIRDCKKNDLQMFCDKYKIKYKKAYKIDKLIQLIIKKIKDIYHSRELK
jgi:hypothetical protein